jgi:hypothetical protein
VVLVLVGAKMLLSDVHELPVGLSLDAIALVLASAARANGEPVRSVRSSDIGRCSPSPPVATHCHPSPSASGIRVRSVPAKAARSGRRWDDGAGGS